MPTASAAGAAAEVEQAAADQRDPPAGTGRAAVTRCPAGVRPLAVGLEKGSSGGRRPAFDPEKYKQRRAVECGGNCLKRNRTVAIGYDKLDVHHEATAADQPARHRPAHAPDAAQREGQG